MIHLVFWHEQYVAITASLLAGAQPRLVTGTFKAANARAVEENKDVPVAALLARLQRAQAQLAKRYLEARDLSISFKVGGKARLYDDAVERIEAHIREHLRKLKCQARFRPGG